MRIVNIHEAKTHLSKLVKAVIGGSEILIALAGKPVAKLGPIEEKTSRQFGLLKGKVRISEDFDAPLSSELLDDFER